MPGHNEEFEQVTYGMLLAYVDERPANILMSRARGRTLEYIGRFEQHAITRERIRQIQDAALAKLPMEIKNRLDEINAMNFIPKKREIEQARTMARQALKAYLRNLKLPLERYDYREIYQSCKIDPIASDPNYELTGTDALEQIYQDYGVRLVGDLVRCWKCGTFKLLTEYNPRAQKDPEHNQVMCRECGRLRQNAYYWKNREKQKAYNLSLRKRYPERVRMAEHKSRLRRKIGVASKLHRQGPPVESIGVDR